MKKVKTKKVDYGNSQAFHLAAKLLNDSAFPFSEKDMTRLIMQIKRKTIVISKSSMRR